VFEASYLVLGLGDVYLGAPCAVPVNPLHRLVTTKMNPARTFTHEGTVGIGGSYMCIYPMDSPGGYQLVGRTLPIWSTFGRTVPFNPTHPWLLEFFDQVGRAMIRLLTHVCNLGVLVRRLM
jgi:urea carboxylase